VVRVEIEALKGAGFEQLGKDYGTHTNGYRKLTNRDESHIAIILFSSFLLCNWVCWSIDKLGGLQKRAQSY